MVGPTDVSVEITMMVYGSRIGSGIRDPGSRIRDPGSGIWGGGIPEVRRTESCLQQQQQLEKRPFSFLFLLLR